MRHHKSAPCDGNLVTRAEYVRLVRSDLYRLRGQADVKFFLRCLLLGGGYGAFQYIFWMRTCRYLSTQPMARLLLPFGRLILRRYGLKYGIDIPYTTEIGCGFYIGHSGNIVINAQAVIGRDCNVSHGVTIGQANRGSRKGCAHLGDRVYLGPGAKVVGAVWIGSDVAVGANCVVTKDVPDSATVVGVPGRMISSEGAVGYIDHTDY